MDNRLVITEDITDWRDECLRTEAEIKSEDDLITLVVNDKYTTGQVGRMAIVQRELGIAPANIITPNKVLLAAGARATIAVMISRRHTEVEMPNGTLREVRTYIAPSGRKPGVPEDDDNGNKAEVVAIAPLQTQDTEKPDISYASFDTQRGVDLAINWLENWIPGVIFERLKQIAGGGGDVQAAGEMLHDKIDELVGRLTKPALP